MASRVSSQENARWRSETSINIPPEDPRGTDHLFLSSFNLPREVLNAYTSGEKQVESVFPWQYKWLSKVLSGESLVISAPTSAGKMLIAEIAAVKSALEKREKVLMIMPYVSAVLETEANFKSLLNGQNVSIGAFAGSSLKDSSFLTKDIAICTIERCYSLLLGSHVEEYKPGLIIVDELHMIGEKGRGYVLELLLTKILYDYSEKDIQILGMSATLPNVEDVASWLCADFEITYERPVKLEERIRIGCNLYDLDKNLLSSSKSEDGDSFLKDICCDRMENDHSVLIFCHTKSQCESLAITLAEALPDKVQKSLNEEAVKKVLQELLKDEGNEIFKTIIPRGVGYHHGGLSFDNRKIIEEAFRSKLLKVIVSTTTLSMGVNLPAHLVIVRSPIKYIGSRRELLDTRMYKQMIGRAGRQGFTTFGESILMCEECEKDEGWKLFQAKPEPVQSFLGSYRETKNRHEIALRKGLLDIADHRSAHKTITEGEFQCYFYFTFFSNECSVEASFDDALKFLSDEDFISIDEETGIEGRKFVISPLGLATRSSNLAPERALVLHEKLKIIKEIDNNHVMIIIYMVALMYNLQSNHRIKVNSNVNLFRQPDEIKEVFQAMNEKVTNLPPFIALILYEMFELNNSLEAIAEKYEVTQIPLKCLQNEILIHAEKMMLFSEKFELPKYYVEELERFTMKISESKNIKMSSNSIKKERKRSRSPEPAEIPSPTKVKMDDKMQQDKENVLGAPPKLGQLILLKFDSGELRIMNEAVNEWKTIGDLLEFDDSGSQVSAIGKNKDPTDSVREVFRLWLQGKGKYQPPTWAKLIKLLEDSGLKALAEKVRNAISS